MYPRKIEESAEIIHFRGIKRPPVNYTISWSFTGSVTELICLISERIESVLDFF